MNLQLTDSRTGYNVWADTIDGKRADLIKLIDDVSSRTVAGLNQKLGVQKSRQRLRAAVVESASVRGVPPARAR